MFMNEDSHIFASHGVPGGDAVVDTDDRATRPGVGRGNTVFHVVTHLSTLLAFQTHGQQVEVIHGSPLPKVYMSILSVKCHKLACYNEFFFFF